jgi:hypothetical protein
MTFEDYLAGKKIDSQLFREHEPELWSAWEQEFGQQHPSSFTAQKLYLINPLRRKYLLKNNPASAEKPMASEDATAQVDPPAGTSKPVVKPARPVFRPKPKT